MKKTRKTEKMYTQFNLLYFHPLKNKVIQIIYDITLAYFKRKPCILTAKVSQYLKFYT